MMICVCIFAFVLGAVIGSFLNVVIYRVPNKISIIWPASHCPKCKTPLKWQHNIPILSWLFLGGKCHHCKAKISARYILVELINAVLWLVCALVFWQTSIVVAVCSALALSVLIAISCVDAKHKWIPDSFQIALLLLAVVLTIFDPTISAVSHIVGLAVGGGIMALFYALGYLLYKKEALGIGDIKLMAICGLLLGWQGVIIAIFGGAIVGAVALLALSKGKNTGKEYAFAPYLVIGTIISMFFSSTIVSAYLSLF